ncbi:MAG: hypothetical protein JWQ44_2961 [Chthoniobacter sp.]|nr:hypothetical protein [Chthoniobacter sp.]
MTYDTQVRLIIGASAYACIKECGVQFDVRLAPGRSAAVALREYAEVERARAACIIENANRAERAATVLEAARNAPTECPCCGLLDGHRYPCAA